MCRPAAAYPSAGGWWPVRALYWSVRLPRRDLQRLHLAAEVLVALALVGAGLGVSRLSGAPLPVLAAAERAVGRWLPAAAAASGPAVQARVVAAAAGRAVLIVAGQQAALIDGGPPAVGEAIVDQLRAQGITRLQAAILTAGSAGEALGLLPVLDAMPVGRILDLVPGSACPGHQAVLADAAAHGTPVQAAARGGGLSLGAARLEVAFAAAGGGEPGAVRLVDGSTRILFAANLAAGEAAGLASSAAQAQVLEVPLAPGALDAALLHTVAPRVALLSASGASSARQELAAAGVVGLTAGSGDLSLQTDGQGLVLGVQPALAGQGAADSTNSGPPPGGGC